MQSLFEALRSFWPYIFVIAALFTFIELIFNYQG